MLSLYILLTTFYDMPLSQLLQLKLRIFPVCFCLFAGMAESISHQKDKVFFYELCREISPPFNAITPGSAFDEKVYKYTCS